MFLKTLALAAILAGFVIPASSAAPVTVYNQGLNSDVCGIGFNGNYEGAGTVIFDSGGTPKFFQCHATLVSGTAVTETVVIMYDDCIVTFKPSGVADCICRI
jgi:hypothetical protein